MTTNHDKLIDKLVDAHKGEYFDVMLPLVAYGVPVKVITETIVKISQVAGKVILEYVRGQANEETAE